MTKTENIISLTSLKDLLKKKGKNKFNAIKTKRGEKTFHSKLEARFYDILKYQQDNGSSVKFFLTQVPLSLPGNTKYLVDFVVFYWDGTIEFIETKGRMTDIAYLKIKLAEETYPIEIKIVTQKDLNLGLPHG